MIIPYTKPSDLGTALNKDMASCQVSARLRGGAGGDTRWVIEAKMNDGLTAVVFVADFDPTKKDLEVTEHWISLRIDGTDEETKLRRFVEAEALEQGLWDKLLSFQEDPS